MSSSPENPAIAAAMQKARIKREVAVQLAQLPLEAQRDIIADLMIYVSGQLIDADVKRQRAAQAASAPAEPVAPRVPQRNAMSKRRRGRPKGSTVGGSMADAVYETLKEHPRTSIADLAEKHYPGDGGGKHKVRAVLWSLKSQGRATNVEPGKWEVTPKSSLTI